MSKTVVLLGDSMIDTFDFMGYGSPELREELKKGNSPFEITLKNHGVGGSTVELGLHRITSPFDYSERARTLPAISDEKPDLVVIESFAYNHWSDSQEDLNRYLNYHRKIIEQIQRSTKAKILLLAMIAPNRKRFASGVLDLQLTKEQRITEYNLVIKYLSSFVNFAKKSGLPLLDLCISSLDNTKTGNLVYISNVDYVHLSFEGRLFVAKALAQKIITLLKGK